MLGEVLSTLNIAEKIVRFWKWAQGKRNPVSETVAARFVRLFESHDVHRNQIPRFFGHGLALKDVQSDADLLPKLDETVLQAACDLFAVRREWLDGAEAQIYSCQDFYKKPGEAAGFLQSLTAKTLDGKLDGVLFAPEQKEGEALIIFRETIGAVGEKEIYRYHLLNNWSFGYWKARGYLAACVAIAWKHGVYIRGLYIDSKTIRELAQGTCLVGSDGEGIDTYGGRKWYPEDLLLKPNVFLEGIDPELNNFGISSAIDLWLRLDEQGFMDAGLEMYDRQTVRAQFMAADPSRALDPVQ
ncbi:hypothetical protein [Uliginosibacterium sp. H1]|uniref:hypothetical protein n=1 Tax=Uliginosibacterium sp. H1 TaxID=3114757 RepID=UPI002E179721|nr:hypothetical protein [Uliginosibacterium sp. H1]